MENCKNQGEKVTEEEFNNALKTQKWTFAKTYAKTAPHEYFLEQDNPELFKELTKRIADSGKDGKFYNTTFRYYYHEEHKYWQCENVLNRDNRNAIYPGGLNQDEKKER